MIINRPCTSCGLSLEKGANLVAAADIFLGCVGTILWSALIHQIKGDSLASDSLKGKSERNQDVKGTSLESNDFTLEVYIVLLVSCVAQVVMGFILCIGVAKKNVRICYMWLLISAVTMLANGILPKLYEMIVVYAYSEELKGEAHGDALMEFRKLPYMCNIKTLVYPTPVYGSSKGRGKMRRNTGFFYNRSFFVNNQISAVFPVHDDHRPSVDDV